MTGKFLRRFVILVVGLICLGLFVDVKNVEAAGSGVSVTPAIVKLDLDTEEPEVVLTYQNGSEKEVNISFSTVDVSELEEGYKPSFLDEKSSQNYRYRLSEWMHLSKTSFVLKPNEIETIKVQIDKERLTPGGHYGSVMANLSDGTSSEQVGLQGVLASLIFVRAKTGYETESASVNSFGVSRSWLDFPKSAVIKFNNTGNTDLTPYGRVEIKDFLGRVVSVGILNESSEIVLPESIRRFNVKLKNDFGMLFPGVYTASLSTHFGKGQQQQLVVESSFVSNGSFGFIFVVIALLLAALIFRNRRGLKRAKRLNQVVKNRLSFRNRTTRDRDTK